MGELHLPNDVNEMIDSRKELETFMANFVKKFPNPEDDRYKVIKQSFEKASENLEKIIAEYSNTPDHEE